MEKAKEIDAVLMVRRIREAHYETLKGATRAERIAFYNSKVRRPEEGRVTPDRERDRSEARGIEDTPADCG